MIRITNQMIARFIFFHNIRYLYEGWEYLLNTFNYENYISLANIYTLVDVEMLQSNMTIIIK